MYRNNCKLSFLYFVLKGLHLIHWLCFCMHQCYTLGQFICLYIHIIISTYVVDKITIPAQLVMRLLMSLSELHGDVHELV